ncbi:hypothetical protein [Micromonospora sp. L32]|uniref:hypothetical protein n=1 Tax=Micromonospora sp. L32 TaxID=3452214 RepID=UPI003F8951A0
MKGVWQSASRRAERERLASAALIHESNQNWLHHRHLETQRGQYLGFFFTALLASAGLLTSIATQDRRDTDLVVLGGALLCFILMIVSFAIYAAVRKLGAVLRFYDREIRLLRQKLFANLEQETGGYGERELAGLHVPPIMRTRVYSAQGVAENILASTCVLLLLIQEATAALVLITPSTGAVVRWGTVTLALAALILAGLLATLHLRVRRATRIRA